MDTAPLIYFIEKHPRYLSTIDPFFNALDRGLFQAVTSTLTLTEALVLPLRTGNNLLVSEYVNILTKSRNVTMLPVSEAIAAKAAQLRATAGIRTPDAVQIATAQIGGATALVTNDEQLASIPGINIIVLEKLLVTP
ncbi:MAG TPA: PIN domain-containing protein [Terracidiphilus sp.]|nr:PIN domain-containing protein [Terracidiphilus sp.]